MGQESRTMQILRGFIFLSLDRNNFFYYRTYSWGSKMHMIPYLAEKSKVQCKGVIKNSFSYDKSGGFQPGTWT